MFKKTINGINESGCEIPNIENISLTNKPAIIRYATLRPEDNNIVSNRLKWFAFNKLRKTKPGTNVRYTKPNICRTIGISKNMAIFRAKNSIRTEKKNVLDLYLDPVSEFMTISL
ncbi:MAG: hypothetical protein NUK62_07920 [Tenericutes bacterium]|nr:hypothetical protein [Mycoplasmatota bacterium]